MMNIRANSPVMTLRNSLFPLFMIYGYKLRYFYNTPKCSKLMESPEIAKYAFVKSVCSKLFSAFTLFPYVLIGMTSILHPSNCSHRSECKH
jgi:hypothetical protein